MAQTMQWVAPEGIQTALSTDLNALGNGSTSALSAEISNETGLYQFMNIELNLASLTPVLGGWAGILLVSTLDGTNFLDLDINFLDRIVTTVIGRNAAAAQRIGKENIPIPPLDFKLAVHNSMGVAFGATGNTLKYRRHNGQAV